MISIILLITTNSAFSQTKVEDTKGSKDHPLISRYPDTHIVSYHSSEFDEFMYATGPITKEIHSQQGRTALPPVERHEGKTISINYKANRKNISALAIYRNFEKAFNKNGFNKIFSCRSDQECGDRFVVQLYWYGDTSRQGRHRYLDAPNLHGKRHNYFYWSGIAKAQDNNYLISLLVGQDVAVN